MGTPRRHHFVQGAYLERFTESGQVFVAVGTGARTKPARSTSRWRGLHASSPVGFAIVVPIEFFEDLGRLYRAQFMKAWRAYERAPSPRAGLGLFLFGYGYERQGRAPNFPHAAYFALEEIEEVRGEQLWRRFTRLLPGRGLNENLNPLYHTAGRCLCASCVLSGTDGHLVDVVAESRAALQSGRIRGRYDDLQVIRGIGPKIASFFLRDVADWYGLEPGADREVLQPVDVWVRRTIEVLSGERHSDMDVQRWICGNSTRSEKANQGIWYFAAQIAGSDLRLQRALRDEKYARELVEEYVAGLRGAAHEWEGLR